MNKTATWELVELAGTNDRGQRFSVVGKVLTEETDEDEYWRIRDEAPQESW